MDLLGVMKLMAVAAVAIALLLAVAGCSESTQRRVKLGVGEVGCTYCLANAAERDRIRKQYFTDRPGEPWAVVKCENKVCN